MEAPLADVVEEDQQKVITAYTSAMEKLVASAAEVKVRNVKTGEIFKVRMILAPLSYKNNLFAIHFLNKI